MLLAEPVQHLVLDRVIPDTDGLILLGCAVVGMHEDLVRDAHNFLLALLLLFVRSGLAHAAHAAVLGEETVGEDKFADTFLFFALAWAKHDIDGNERFRIEPERIPGMLVDIHVKIDVNEVGQLQADVDTANPRVLSFGFGLFFEPSTEVFVPELGHAAGYGAVLLDEKCETLSVVSVVHPVLTGVLR